MQITIVERKRGVSSWVKMGPASLVFLVESLVLCIKDSGKGKWERSWKENGRFFSLVRDLNKGGCFLRLGVVDPEGKRYSIFIPKGKGAKGGWASLMEALQSLDVVSGKSGNKKVEVRSSKSLLGKTFAVVVRNPSCEEKTMARVVIGKNDISRNVEKLSHCLVGFWDPNSRRGDDLRGWGTQMAKIWGLKGNLGLAKLERGKALMEFEILAEAEKVLKIGKILVGDFHMRLEKWSREMGCQMEGERKGEAWDQAILRRVGEECGGFLAIDSQTEKMEELQWARILVKIKGKELPNTVEIWVEEECYTLTLWWEVRSFLKSLLVGKKGKISGSEGEVEGEGATRAGKHVRLGEGVSSPDALLSGLGCLVDRPRETFRVQNGLLRGMQGLGGPSKPDVSDGPFLGLGPDGPFPSSSSLREAGPSSCGPLFSEASKGPKVAVLTGPARQEVNLGLPKAPLALEAHVGEASPLEGSGPVSSRNTDAKSPSFWELDDQWRKAEVELQEKLSTTDSALCEEASRYEDAPIHLVDSASSSLPLLFSGRTPLGEYYGHSGDERDLVEGETPRRLSFGLGISEAEFTNSWELKENNNGSIGNNEDCGKELCLLQPAPLDVKGWGEASWGESELAKFSKFLGFPTEGLEKDLADFLIKIRRRREKIHSKTLLEKSKFERELKKLECSINYEGGGGGSRRRDCKKEGARFWKLNEDKTVELECSWS
ncbi:hypothetical protein PVL29_015719 [Vitis rotundifolia]|uniref:DUF4283 domain-containing protein n=1 Tax=Vitis rotundifolia TaxID=103349 RepID=A0AA39DK67_VITRO|nr:hypothetical protein PVL29_015719 [Vitis rotundifolia]